MKIIIIAFLAVYLAESSFGQDCSAKIKDFHKCLADSHKQGEATGKAKWEALKPKFEACFTDNGCTVPAKPQKGQGSSSGGNSSSASGEKDSAGGECKKALREAFKGQFETCIQKAIPGFTFPPPQPQSDGEHDKPHHFRGHKGFNHKDENKKLDGCANKQAVRNCTRALFESNRPSEDEMKAQFQAQFKAGCDCVTALGSDCQAKMEQFKKAACECRQQQRQQFQQIRSGIAACNGPQANESKGKHGQGKEHKQETCGDEKDYCKAGFDVLVQDMKAKFGGKNGN